MKQDYMLSEICQNPTFLVGIDWKEFTEWFDEGRIHEIIKTIECDAVCDLVCDYIRTEWYVAANGEIKTNPDNPHQSLIEYTGEILWNGEEVWHYRFEPLEDENSVYRKLPRIEDLVDKAKTGRERNKKREARKRELKERCERLAGIPNPKGENMGEGLMIPVSEFAMRVKLDKSTEEEIEINHLKSEIENLQSENNKLRLELKKTEGLAKQTGHKTSEDMPESRKKSRKRIHMVETLDEEAKFVEMAEIGSAKEQYAKEKIIEMLHHFIQFGEKYPSNMNAKGEAIRDVIDDYLRIHPDSLFDEEWYARLQKLGRKEVAMKIETINSRNTHIKDSHISNFYEKTE